MKIGFVGTGIMGAPMAAHLQKGGHDLLLFRHRSPVPEALLARGAAVYASLAELARDAEVVITMLPDTPDVEAALFGEGGLAAGLDGKLFIDMSSISPIATKTFAERVIALGADYIDAPVSGGEVGARNATLTIMAGGDPEAFARAEPLFRLMGQNITRVGGVGDGQIAKVANQIIVALTIEAVAEGLLFASKAGADVGKVRAALLGGFASSRILEVHGERMINRTFDPGFRIGLHSKDLDLALSAAKSLGLALPGTASAQQLFNACIGMGEGERDHSGMLLALEALAAHRLA
ncbi:MAG: 2-hydroxy-3-oxopropionate reductase [Novosphingobium sp.]